MRGVKKRLKEAGEVKNTPIYLSPLSALLNVVKKKQNDFPKRFLWNVLQAVHGLFDISEAFLHSSWSSRKAEQFEYYGIVLTIASSSALSCFSKCWKQRNLIETFLVPPQAASWACVVEGKGIN